MSNGNAYDLGIRHAIRSLVGSSPLCTMLAKKEVNALLFGHLLFWGLFAAEIHRRRGWPNQVASLSSRPPTNKQPEQDQKVGGGEKGSG